METLLMKGKPVADAYRETVSAKITAAKEKGIKVTLAIIVVGDDPASHVYKDRLVKLQHRKKLLPLSKNLIITAMLPVSCR